MAKKILLPAERLVDSNIKIGQREGTIIEKGVILNEDYLVDNKEKIGDVMSIFSAYPDVYLDLIKPQDSSFTLFFYQRITLRALMRFKDIFVTAPRAFSKSFITILAMILQCIFIPGTKRFICAPNKTQAAQIAKEKIVEIYDRWPMLRKEIIGGEISDTPGNFGKDYVTLKFRNGSQFDVVGALDSQRGGRRHGGLIDEVRDHEEAPPPLGRKKRGLQPARAIEKDGERKKKRCARKRANGERKEPNPVPSHHLMEGVETNQQGGFYHHSKRRPTI